MVLNGSAQPKQSCIIVTNNVISSVDADGGLEGLPLLF